MDESIEARIRRKLLKHMERLLDAQLTGPAAGRMEGRIARTAAALRAFRDDGDTLTARLESMADFTRFCLSSFTEEQMSAVRPCVVGYLDHLKKEAGG